MNAAMEGASMQRLMDVTLREACASSAIGADDDALERLARDLLRCGLDAVEVGYYRPEGWGDGPAPASCPPAYLRRMHAALSGTRMSVLTHLHRVAPGELEAAGEAGVELIRIGVQCRELPALRARVGELRACGVPFSINAIRVSEQPPDAVLELARVAEGEGAEMFYVADSNGGLLPSQLAALGRRIREAVGLPLGAHLHDNLSLAFANALTALELGFTWIDGTLAGVGKGGGNLSTERAALYLAATSGRTLELDVLSRLSREWSDGQALDRFWSTVHGTLNLNQDRASDLMQLSEPERLRLCSAQLGLQSVA